MLRSVKYGLHGAVLAGLVALPVVWNSVDKTVDLVVDGRAQSIHTTADRVGEVLADAGLRVGKSKGPSRSWRSKRARMTEGVLRAGLRKPK